MEKEKDVKNMKKDELIDLYIQPLDQYVDHIVYKGLDVAFSIISSEKKPLNGKVPQYITVLGARKMPTIKSPAAMSDINYEEDKSEGGKWESLQKILAEAYLLGGIEKYKDPEKFFSNEINGIKKEIAKEYEVAGIYFGFDPTVNSVYKPSKLNELIKRKLVKSYGEYEKPKSIEAYGKPKVLWGKKREK